MTSRAYKALYRKERPLRGENADWCFDFENKVETLRILNIADSNPSETKKKLQDYIKTNGEKYNQLVS